jgi:dihydropteroate synthase
MKMNTGTEKMFQQFPVLNFGGKLMSLETPRVMGILNVTPDSFYDGGKYTQLKAIVRHAGKMLKEGADILDLGAQSTRPGAPMISVKTELQRLIPAIRAIKDKYPDSVVSADTFTAEVAEKAIESGAAMINDVSGGQFDSGMFKTAGRLKVPYVLMHLKGTPATMQSNPRYADVTESVLRFFATRIPKLEKAGVTDIVIDPGFGFGKTAEHNYTLLRNLPVLLQTGRPCLIGVSRKSMIYKGLGITPQQSLNGTTALNMAALLGGASLLRVHDVKEASECLRLYLKLKGAS